VLLKVKLKQKFTLLSTPTILSLLALTSLVLVGAAFLVADLDKALIPAAASAL